MASTALQWLIDNPGDVEALDALLREAGVPVSVLLEYPDWLKSAIAERLAETFQQDYWDDISEATAGDAERILAEGLRDGWSINQMASQMLAELGSDDYARARSKNIARTEACNALNGARRAGMDALIEELPEVKARPTWVSVLGTTTRPEHADLDGVPADDEGMWTLAGYRIPWPGHVSLPPEHRCNCQCTIVVEFGMGAEEAQRLIDEYWERVESKEAGRQCEAKERRPVRRKYDPDQSRGDVV